MKINWLDHVNIIAEDLDGTAQFYAELFGLARRDAPPPLTPQNAQWMYDGSGKAIFHINSVDCPRAFPRDVAPGPTGSIHHVALNCSGHDEMIARLEARGRVFDCRANANAGLRQIFTQDPNGVLLELNFRGE